MQYYFESIQIDADKGKGASLRYASWIDLRYRLWKLTDKDFNEAILAIKGILDSYDSKASESLKKEMVKSEKKATSQDQKRLMQLNDTKSTSPKSQSRQSAAQSSN